MTNQNQRLSQGVPPAPPTPGTANIVTAFETKIKQWWGPNGKKMASLCGSEDTARKLFVTALNVVMKTPKLIECNFETFCNCLLQSAELNLFPGAMQECAYVPLKNSKANRLEANWWPMYPGLVKLAFRSGFIKNISCEVVYSADEFDFGLGTKTFVHHRPFTGPNAERGTRQCVYACIQTVYGEWQIKVLSMDFIEGIRSRSPAARSSDSPWNTGDDNYDAMARKTALKQDLKFIPKSAELARAIEIDNEEERPDLAKTPLINLSGLTAGVITPEGTGSQEPAQPTLPQPEARPTMTTTVDQREKEPLPR